MTAILIWCWLSFSELLNQVDNSRTFPPCIPREDRPFMIGKDGKNYQQNPTNQYDSLFIDWFDGYLGYDSPQHLFKLFPRKEHKSLRNIFGRNFGLTSFPLGRNRAHLLFLYLVLPSNLLRPLLFQKNLGLLRFHNSNLTLLGQLRVRKSKLTQIYVKYYALWQFSFVSLKFSLFVKIPYLLLLITIFPQLTFI